MFVFDLFRLGSRVWDCMVVLDLFEVRVACSGISWLFSIGLRLGSRVFGFVGYFRSV